VRGVQLAGFDRLPGERPFLAQACAPPTTQAIAHRCKIERPPSG
jgi:hypothetical protein